MSTDQEIEARVKEISRDLKRGRHRIFCSGAEISPESLWDIERLIQRYSRKGANKMGSPFDPNLKDAKELRRELGLYIGEVVRQYHAAKSGMKYSWNYDEAKPFEAELNWPDDSMPTLFPMRFISKQIRKYEKGSLIAWGGKAGLKINREPNRLPARFR
jgi:hypothetical protein